MNEDSKIAPEHLQQFMRSVEAGVQNIQANQALEDARKEAGHLARAAAKAQVALQEQMDRLNQQTGELLKIAEAQKRLAENLERQTAMLVGLTRAVKIFTVVLVVLTIGLFLEGAVQFFEFRGTIP